MVRALLMCVHDGRRAPAVELYLSFRLHFAAAAHSHLFLAHLSLALWFDP